MTEESPISYNEISVQSEESVPIESERILIKHNFTLAEKILSFIGILLIVLLVFVNYLKIVE